MKYQFNHRILILFWILAIPLNSSNLLSQQIWTPENALTNGHLDDSSKSISKPDSLRIKYIQSKHFYDSLSFKSQKKGWTRQLHDMIIKSHQESNSNGYDYALKFQAYQGKIIRKIYVQQVNVFGESVYDTLISAERWREKAGNSLHINTISRSIKNKLLIEEGDLIAPLILADNERLLRNLPNIKDANIEVNSSSVYSDSVDITIITQDVWPIGFSFDLYDVAYGRFGVWNKNLLGLGHEITYTGAYNLDRNPQYTYAVKYQINSIKNSFVSTSFEYKNDWNLEAYRFFVNREFFTPSIRYAGGFGFQNINQNRNIILIDTILPSRLDYNLTDAWMGKSIPLKKFNTTHTRSNAFITSRYLRYNYFNRPEEEVQKYSLYQLHNRDIFLLSIGISKEGFYKSHLVYGFGTPEDIPYGHTIKLTTGYEVSEFSTRPYLGFEMSGGSYYDKIGYLYGNFQIGGFFKNEIEQGALSFVGKYISKLIGEGRYKYRFYSKLTYQKGLNRFDGEYLDLDKNDGIRGFQGSVLNGKERTYINTEFVNFSPHYLYGFRFVYYIFADAGIINTNSLSVFDNPVYTSVGFGVRIRNERLVFNTIQLRFAYFPNTLPGVQTESLQLISYPRQTPESFRITKPELINHEYYWTQ